MTTDSEIRAEALDTDEWRNIGRDTLVRMLTAIPPPEKITGKRAPARSSAADAKLSAPPGPRSTRIGRGMTTSASP